MEDQPPSILLALQEINNRLKRIEADMESEKDTRKERNKNIDLSVKELSDRIAVLEKDKVRKDAIIWLVGILCTAAGMLAGYLIKH